MTSIDELESLVRAGRFDVVEDRLRKCLPSKVDRKDALALANIARRINLPYLALRILNPIVRPKMKGKPPASDSELLEYAESLRRAGALDEAWKILNGIDPELTPQVLLFRAFCLINQWRYGDAIPVLLEYVQTTGLTPYERAVAKVNLAASMLQQDQLNEVETFLTQLREETLQSEFLLLYGNCLELTGQLKIRQENYDEALAILAESRSTLGHAGAVENLLSQKWKAIADALKQDRVTCGLIDLHKAAQSAKHWETVRECELYIAILQKDESLLHRIYFGTPNESYRRRIMQMVGKDLNLPETYVWSPNHNPRFVLDLRTGKVEGARDLSLPTGRALHRFLIVAGRDFYRPLPMLGAFSYLFPDEYMNVITSPNRVHQVVKRCRDWLTENNLDLEIRELDRNYTLVPGQDFGLRVPADLLPTNSMDLEFQRLAIAVGKKEFSKKEASGHLKFSDASTQRLLQWALRENKIEKLGIGSQTRYRQKK